MENLRNIKGRDPSLYALSIEGIPFNERFWVYMTFKLLDDSGEWFLCFSPNKPIITKAGLYSPEFCFDEKDREKIRRKALPESQFHGSLIADILGGKYHECLVQKVGNIIGFSCEVGGKKIVYHFKP